MNATRECIYMYACLHPTLSKISRRNCKSVWLEFPSSRPANVLLVPPVPKTTKKTRRFGFRTRSSPPSWPLLAAFVLPLYANWTRLRARSEENWRQAKTRPCLVLLDDFTPRLQNLHMLLQLQQ